MSVLIKGMEMPKGCFFCPMRIKIDPDTIRCLATGNDFEETLAGTIERRNNGNCPLEEIPPHGDLVDKDKLMQEFMDSDLDHLQRDDWREVIQIVQDAPTIIEAEGSEDEQNK